MRVTPIMLSDNKKHVYVLIYLLHIRVYVRIQDFRRNDSLHYVITNGWVACVDELLGVVGNTDGKNLVGFFPLVVVKEMGQYKCTTIIRRDVGRRTDLNSADGMGNAPLTVLVGSYLTRLGRYNGNGKARYDIVGVPGGAYYLSLYLYILTWPPYIVGMLNI